MASVNSPRGLVLARKNGSGSNSTGVTMIPVGDNISPIVPSAALPTSMFTGDPIDLWCRYNYTYRCKPNYKICRSFPRM